jgi:hypothetical protein
MNSRFLAIGIPATAFVLTIAISLWQQRADAPAPGNAQPGPAAQVPGQDPPQTASLSATQIGSPPATPPTAPASPSPPSPSAGGDIADPRIMDVPLRLAFRNLPGQSHLSVMALNMSTDDLEARVTAVSATTHLRSVVDVSLHGHERKNLASAGLEVATGDQVTIEGPPYRNLSLVAQ